MYGAHEVTATFRITDLITRFLKLAKQLGQMRPRMHVVSQTWPWREGYRDVDVIGAKRRR